MVNISRIQSGTVLIFCCNVTPIAGPFAMVTKMAAKKWCGGEVEVVMIVKQ